MNRAVLLLAVQLACNAGSGSSGESAREEERDEAAQGAAPIDRDAGLPPPAALPKPAMGLPPMEDPEYNPTTPAKVALGRLLFFDSRLSRSRKLSCASCHKPEHGYSEAVSRGTTDRGRKNARHTPTLWNAGYAGRWSWDGAMELLEAQILSHWRGQLGASPDAVAKRLTVIPGYIAHFSRAFDSQPSSETAAEALAAFVRTLTIGDSPWDRYEAGDRLAVSDEAVAGFEVFRNIAQCAQCHAPPLYSDHRFHALSIASEKADLGRMRITQEPIDRGAFRTPHLRGLVHTAPYLHDGSAASLEDVVQRKLASGIMTGNLAVDSRLASLRLDRKERAQLVAFLRSLSSPTAPPSKRPRLPKAPPPPIDAGASGDAAGPAATVIDADVSAR